MMLLIVVVVMMVIDAVEKGKKISLSLNDRSFKFGVLKHAKQYII
jgi:hypothetical protein